jgi:hypothetical protein
MVAPRTRTATHVPKHHDCEAGSAASDENLRRRRKVDGERRSNDGPSIEMVEIQSFGELTGDEEMDLAYERGEFPGL